MKGCVCCCLDFGFEKISIIQQCHLANGLGHYTKIVSDLLSSDVNMFERTIFPFIYNELHFSKAQQFWLWDRHLEERKAVFSCE